MTSEWYKWSWWYKGSCGGKEKKQEECKWIKEIEAVQENKKCISDIWMVLIWCICKKCFFFRIIIIFELHAYNLYHYVGHYDKSFHYSQVFEPIRILIFKLSSNKKWLFIKFSAFFCTTVNLIKYIMSLLFYHWFI